MLVHPKDVLPFSMLITLCVQDLKKAMPDLGHGLQQLLDYPGDVEADLALTFSFEEDHFGEVQTNELKPGGSQMPVTNSNRQEYVDLYTHWVLQESVQTQFTAFSEGFLQASHMCSLHHRLHFMPLAARGIPLYSPALFSQGVPCVTSGFSPMTMNVST